MDKQQYSLLKFPIKLLIKSDYIVSLTSEEEDTYTIQQGDSLLFDQIERLRGSFSSKVKELILIEAPKNPKTESSLKEILDEGFYYNGVHYVRFGKSASQGKAGITAFLDESMYDELYKVTQMDVEIDCCVISKYESQRCLVFSSCTLVEDFFPRICIIDEYEKIIPNQHIKYVVERQKEYTDKDGVVKKYNAREIEDGFHDIKISPFDGCGCHEKEFMEKVSSSLELDYNAIGVQVRVPLVKGYSVYVPFREIFKTWGVTEITDVYGKVHNIDEIDCIWNTTMFKGHKLFKQKYGNDAWNMYLETIKKYNFKLGISKYSHHVKDINVMARMNFQYLQCLDLWNPKYIENFKSKDKDEYYDVLDENNDGKIVKLAKYTTNLLEKIIKGDKFYTYKFLGMVDSEYSEVNSNYLKAVLLNDTMLKDPAIKIFLQRKLQKFIAEAKLGKIYVDGFYHTVVGDMIGYLQYAAKYEPVGCLKAKEFYCNTLRLGKAISFRSPLVCPSEVNDIELVDNDILRKWFSYFENQDVVMINMYDISLPQQGGIGGVCPPYEKL